MKDMTHTLSRIDTCLRGIRGDASFHDMRESLQNISISLNQLAKISMTNIMAKISKLRGSLSLMVKSYRIPIRMRAHKS